MLSEKAKGKQRARDPPDLGSDPRSVHSKSLIIRFTKGVSDLTKYLLLKTIPQGHQE